MALTACLPAKAEDWLAYTRISLKNFGGVRLLIPKDPAQNRIYLKVRLRKPLVHAMALLDDHIVIRPVGNLKTMGVPAELVQPYGDFKEILTFPRSAFQSADRSIVFGLETDNGKETRIRIRGKQLERIRTAL